MLQEGFFVKFKLLTLLLALVTVVPCIYAKVEPMCISKDTPFSIRVESVLVWVVFISAIASWALWLFCEEVVFVNRRLWLFGFSTVAVWCVRLVYLYSRCE